MPTIENKDGVYEEFELSPGCKAAVKAITENDDYGYLVVTLDASQFDAVNSHLLKAGWWDTESKTYSLRASQYYKDWERRSQNLTLCVDPHDDNAIELSDLTQVQVDYFGSGSILSYTQWLEQEYTQLKYGGLAK